MSTTPSSSIVQDVNNEESVVLRKAQTTTAPPTKITTIQKLYTDNDEIELFQIDPRTRRSFINKSAYAKLHRSFISNNSNNNNNRHSVDSLKGKYENLQTNPEIVPEDKIKTKIKRQSTVQLKEEVVDELRERLSKRNKPVPLPKPRRLLKQQSIEQKDENSNIIVETNNDNNNNNNNVDKIRGETDDLSELEERPVIIRPSASEESIDKIAKELSNFTMDRKAKDKKRSSFRRLFSTSLFGSRDKKKKDEEKNRRDNNVVYNDNYENRRENLIYNDNLQNETNYNQQTPVHLMNTNYQQINDNQQEKQLEQRQLTQEELEKMEKQYAEMHINKFNQIRQNFAETKRDYIPMDKPKKKPTISDYISAPVQRYIDTSSSTSSDAEKSTSIRRHNSDIRRDTPPRAQETYQNIKLVKPKASIPINSERSLPNPYQSSNIDNSNSNPQTIERNLNKSNNKDYPDKNDINEGPKLSETYGTVFDSLEYITSKNGEMKPVNSPISPKSPSLESSKLKLPPNREIYSLQPRVKSPIPTNRISTDKIIATELLRNSRSPTPQKNSRIDDGKPPVSPKSFDNPNGGDKIVTNAMVHTPQPQTLSQIELRQHNNLRSPTPNDLRMSASLKLSPQKEDIRKSVEEYYWKELKKMKEKEDYNLYMMQLSNGYIDETARVRRSRSLSPSSQKYGRRSLSLPRDVRPVVPIKDYPDGIYGRLPPQPIPEDQTLVLDARRKLNYEQNFVRNNPERRTIGTSSVPNENLQRPIFRRGSLNKPEIYENQIYNKKVSFINNENNRKAWPTKNGYTQSPPQRRLDKREIIDDDDVFLPNSPRPIQNYNYYNYGQVANEPVYGNRGGLLMPQYDPRVRPPYRPEQIGPRRLSMDSIPRPPQEVYVTRNQLQSPISPQSRPLMKREIIIQDDIYGEFGGYQPQQYSSSLQLANQRNITNPLYSSKQSILESNYNNQPKQVTVTNKYCDMYGQIHDQTPRSGVLMGRLQNPTNTPQSPPNFVRGTRLTASANDMGRRYYHRQPFDSIDDTNTNYDTRPLPPIPNNNPKTYNQKLPTTTISDTESGSDASEVRRIMQNKTKITNNKRRGGGGGGFFDEEWSGDGKSGRMASGNDSGRSDNESEVRSSSSRSRNTRRDDPRRHTLGGDQQYLGMAGQGGPLSRTMDLEGQPRGYPPPTNPMLFDDDPGIMSEVETSSTGFRRGGKQRSSLPVVRTPSKTLERPLGLVFLQYRNETKRALLPNEITSIDTVKALFVRSFPKQLTMEYLDSPNVKIYIHDSSKDMFYELEDLRSHLREIRDRSVLRLFESADVSGGLPMAGIGIAGGIGHFEDPSYFSEPEFDSEYQHQHIHKSKGSAGKGAPYYMGSTASLPRGAALLRTYSPAVGALPTDRLKSLPTGAPPKPQRSYSGGSARSNDGPPRPPDRFVPFQRPANPLFNVPDGYMSSPERSSRYEDPYYSQYAPRSGSITPVIDEEISDTELLDDSYSLYGVKLAPGGPRAAPRSPFPPPTAVPYDATRLRVENMERQLANLTGLVQKALTQTPTTHLQVPGRDNYRTGDEFDKNSSSSSTSLPDDSYLRTDSKAPKLGKSGCHKSVSFEKSVSFSDEPPDMNSPKQHSPQHAADTKPAKPAIKSSTLPRTSSQERDRLKPAPPPKPASLSPGQYDGRLLYRDLQLTPEMYNQLRGLQKKAKDLRTEVRNLRRMSQAQAHSVRETIRDTFIKIRAMLLAGGEQVWQAGMDQERVRLSREEDLYKQEMLRLEKDLSDLESTVEELRGNVINRKTRVNMSDVENMALILSKSSKTVADLKLRFPGLQDSMKSFLSSEMEKVMREEKFLKEEPERLESALRRCKKLTGTLVTLKRLASVQEQRLPCSNPSSDGRLSPTVTETPPITPTSSQHSKSVASARVGPLLVGGDSIDTPSDSSQRPENALDALLDELQTFSKPTPQSQQQQDLNNDQPPAIPAKNVGHHHHYPHHPPTMSEIGRKGSMDSATFLPTQNLTVSTATGSLRRLHSYPSGSDTDNSPPIQPLKTASSASGKPPLPERNTELLQHIVAGKRIPPPPPPRTSSKSPLASPTSPGLPPRCPAAGLQHIQNVQNMVENKPQSQFELATQNLGLSTLRRNVPNRSSIKDNNNKAQTLPRNIGSTNLQIPQDNEQISASNSSSCESVNSQDGTKKTRKEELEQRHQELLKKQKALQEQYARLQQLQRGNNTLTVISTTTDLLKKTGSESNLLQKMGLQMTTSQITGSLTNLPNTKNTLTNTNPSQTSQNKQNETSTECEKQSEKQEQQQEQNQQLTTTNKVYETDIL